MRTSASDITPAPSTKHRRLIDRARCAQVEAVSNIDHGARAVIVDDEHTGAAVLEAEVQAFHRQAVGSGGDETQLGDVGAEDAVVDIAEEVDRAADQRSRHRDPIHLDRVITTGIGTSPIKECLNDFAGHLEKIDSQKGRTPS